MNYDEFVFNNPNEKLCIVKAENKNELKGSILSPSEPLCRMIFSQFNNSYFKSILKLSQCSRNLSNNLDGPNVLYVSENEGCFPRTGLSIKANTSYICFPKLNYVDLVLDENRIKNGELSIYPHEVSHTMIKNLLPNFPKGKSSITHFSACVTDYFTAFDEGLAEHFERITYENIHTFSALRKKKFHYSKNFINLWLCEFDSDLRYDGVLKNDFIYRKLVPDTKPLSPENLILLYETSPIFDKTQLKSAAEMLSCEGVLATIFYIISSDEIIQNNYADDKFYNNFLIKPLPDSIKAHDVFNPWENVIIKILWVIYKLKNSLNSNSTIFIDFIKIWCSCFPKDRRRVLSAFINTTVGKTVENNSGRIYKELALAGMLGQYENFSKLLKVYKESIKDTLTKVFNENLSLDKNVAKQVWVENRAINTPDVLFPNDEKKTLMVNINTASIPMLMSFPSINANTAKSIIQDRDNGIFFNNISEFKLLNQN